MMHQRLTPSTIALLTLPPLLWAGNAVVGRLVHDMVPPMALNFIRWLLAFALLGVAAGAAATARLAKNTQHNEKVGKKRMDKSIRGEGE